MLQCLHRVNLSVEVDIKPHSFGFLGENSAILEKLHFLLAGEVNSILFSQNSRTLSVKIECHFGKLNYLLVSRILQQNMCSEDIPSK